MPRVGFRGPEGRGDNRLTALRSPIPDRPLLRSHRNEVFPGGANLRDGRRLDSQATLQQIQGDGAIHFVIDDAQRREQLRHPVGRRLRRLFRLGLGLRQQAKRDLLRIQVLDLQRDRVTGGQRHLGGGQQALSAAQVQQHFRFDHIRDGGCQLLVEGQANRFGPDATHRGNHLFID